MKTEGVEAIFLTTHNWGRSAKFFQSLGYARLRNRPQLRPAPQRPGPYLFIAEVPADQAPAMQLVMKVADARSPAGPRRRSRLPFQDTHWGTQEMTVRDPDGRVWSLQAPK